MEAQKDHTIQFNGLKDGTHPFTFSLGEAFFTASNDEEWVGGAVVATVRLDKAPAMLVVHLRTQGEVFLNCDHCNSRMSFPIEGEQRQVFNLTGREQFEEDDDVIGLDPDDQEINLTHYFYECIRLALPIRRVHPEGQCDPDVDKALTERITDRGPSADPRWEVLNTLKKQRR